MKTAFKKIIAGLAVGLLAVCLCVIPKKAKAADDNETTYTQEYNFIFVTLSVQYSFKSLGSYSPNYITGPLRFQVYNTKLNSVGSVFTVDYMYTFGNNNGGISGYMLSSGSATPYCWYVPANGTTMSGTGYSQGPALTITKETSETITGTLKAYTTGLYNNTSGVAIGFYVTFNFEVGYKKYTFATDGNSLCAAHGQTVPLTTTIATISADSFSAYNEGYNAGKIEGYETGYDEGEEAGNKAGYAEGKAAGFIEGRDAPDYSFKEFFIGFGDAFVTIWMGMLNFEFLGVNIAGLIGTILVVCLVIFIVKIVKGA